jgi:hypothetical protein
MTETLRRDEFIAILNRLGSDEDEEVLQAARQAHARIAAAGMRWEDLLVPDGRADEPADGRADEPATENEEPATENEEPATENEEPAAENEEPAAESDEADDREPEAVEDEPPAERAGAEGAGAKGAEKDTESLALIGELLARSDISEELRAELDGYKTDIAEGEFVAADRRYLRAIRKRLSKQTKSR